VALRLDTVTSIAAGVVVVVAVFYLVTRPSNQRLSPRATTFLRIVSSIVIAALFGVCLAMLGSLVGYRSPLFALNAAVDILGFVALTRPLFSWRAPQSVQPVRDWERHGRIYRFLGA
jgi:hypothetical protein